MSYEVPYKMNAQKTYQRQNNNHIVQNINKMLEIKGVKPFLILFTGIFLGYVLQPIPKWFNDLVTKSHVFKFTILFIIALLMLHPVDNEKLSIAIVASVVILALLHTMRSFDSKTLY